jgi:hypothetical protein
MSEEKNKRERGTGSIYQPKRSRFWWVKYYRNGKAIRESAHATDKRKAQKFLEKRLGEIGSGNFLGPSVEKIHVSELAEDMFRDYRVNGHKSLQYTEWRWKRHIEPVFAPMRAVQVTTEAVTKYIDNRKAKGAENSTINRELAALKRMFSLAYRSTPPARSTKCQCFQGCEKIHREKALLKKNSTDSFAACALSLGCG